MKFLSLKHLAMTGALSVAGLGLIGVGAHAVFTTSSTSQQQITAGAPSVVLTATGPCSAAVAGTLNLPATGPTNSTFTSGDQTVYVCNNGNIPVTGVSATFGEGGSYSGSGADYWLEHEAYLCVVNSANVVVYNGLLDGAASAIAVTGTILPGNYSQYTVNVFAGSTATTACGSVGNGGAASSGPNGYANTLDNSAVNGVIYPTVTVTYNA